MLKVGSIVLGLTVLAAACGDSDSSGSGEESASSASSEASAAPVSEESASEASADDASSSEVATEVSEEAADSAFPVTVDHMLGSVTIEEKPTRIVTLGFSDADIANALGAEVVLAVASPYGDDGANPFWAPVTLTSEVASLDPFELNMEAIAAANPDLILATAVYPSTLELYDQLSEIAPVVAPITGPLLDSADDLTKLIGTALGESDAAAELLASTEKAATEFREANPSLEGLSVIFAPREGGQTAIFIEPDAASVAFLAQLGFSTPQEVRDLPGDRFFGATFIGDELLGVLDSADIALVGLSTEEDRTTFLGLPTVTSLDLVANEALIELDRPLAAALQSPNPVSILYVLEQLGPRLVEAAG